jgi:hypothetical protein
MPRQRKTTLKVDTPKIKKLKVLSKEKSEAEKLAELLASEIWKNQIQILLDKMIRDTIGGIDRDGIWSSGIVGQPEGKSYSTDYLLGYRMGLIDFNNRLRTQQAKVIKIKKQIEDLQVPVTTTHNGLEGSWSYMPPMKGI